MSFIWPTMLLSLLLIPVFAGLYARQERQRRRLTTSYGTFGLVQTAARESLGWRRYWVPALFLLGLTFLLVALARPQMVVNLPRIEGTVILAFDVSGSMGATDLEPTRLDAAKVAAGKFVEQQPSGILLGVVAFSDSGFAIQVPTYEQAEVLVTINRLTTQNGTSLGNGILASLNTIAAAEAVEPPSLYTNLTPVPTPSPTPVPEGLYTPAVIILLTDGENNETPDPLEVAQIASNRGVRIYTIGLGSPEGTTLEVEGFSVHTRLDEALLQQISEMTDGVYYRADDEAELQAIYDNIDPQFVIKPEDMEVTSIFAGIGTLILLIGGVFSLMWFSRLP